MDAPLLATRTQSDRVAEQDSGRCTGAQSHNQRTAEETSAARAKQLEKATSCLVPGSSTELADRYKKPNKTKLEPLKGIRGSSPLGTRFRRGDLHLYKPQTSVW